MVRLPGDSGNGAVRQIAPQWVSWECRSPFIKDYGVEIEASLAITSRLGQGSPDLLDGLRLVLREQGIEEFYVFIYTPILTV